MLIAEELIGPWYQWSFQISADLRLGDVECDMVEALSKRATQEICEEEDRRILALLHQASRGHR